MNLFDRIVVIFNPNSTGEAPDLAEQLRAELAPRLHDVPVSLSPTQRAGHARDLAREAAESGRPLVVSVNGVMQAGNPDALTAVRAAGNANDHRRATKERPLAEAIEAANVRRIDPLRLTVGDGPEAHIHSAHSYIGMGLTPVFAVDLEKGGKGRSRSRGEVQGSEQVLNVGIDLVAHCADRVDALAWGVVELPVLVAPSLEAGAGIAAAHRDDDVGGLGGVGVEERRGPVGDVDADLVHGPDEHVLPGRAPSDETSWPLPRTQHWRRTLRTGSGGRGSRPCARGPEPAPDGHTRRWP